MDIKKEFEKMLNPIVDEYNLENDIKCSINVEGGDVPGFIGPGTTMSVIVNYIIGPGLDKPVDKRRPIGEDNFSKTVSFAKKLKPFDGIRLELDGIKKDWIANGVKHNFIY